MEPAEGEAELVSPPTMVRQTTGFGGKDVMLLCNYFRMTFDARQKIYQYHVDFEPEVESSQMRRKLLLEHREAFGNAFLFDGMSNLKILKKLIGEELQFVAVRQSDNANITVTLRFTNEVAWNAQEMMRLFNTQMRRNLAHIGYSLIGRYYYDKQGGRTIEEYGGLTVYRGVLTAVAKHESGVLMACDTIYKIIRKQTVRDMLAIWARNRETYQDQARRLLSGAVVMTEYNGRTYRIDDMEFKKTPLDTFEKNGEIISFMDYYQSQYEITIADPRQPLIACLPNARDRRAGRTDKIYLIPELCHMTGLTDKMRADFGLCKQIDAITKLDPQKRVENLRSFIQQLIKNQNVRQDMVNWKLGFDPKIVELRGRQLDNEKILMFGEPEDGGTPYEQNGGDFTKEIRGKQLRATVACNKWVIIVANNDQDCVSAFTSTLFRVCNPMGIALARPKMVVLPADRTSNFVNALKDTPRIEEADIVCCIVPNNNKDRYDSIKKLCCCDLGILSQVVCKKTLSKELMMSVCTKIAIQMACKIGAEAWALRIPPKDLMVVGYDTYHDPIMRGKSAGGFVASINQSLTRWFSKVAFHGNREEMSGNFAVNLKMCMKRYHEVNSKLPERIVIYRDGVGDGMIPHILNYEVDQIKKALNEIPVQNRPRLAFIIVSKKTNTKFFVKTNGGPHLNPPPGTVVDTVVTKAERYDFYLISHSVRQGTVAPTLFNIIYDDTNWRPNHHQLLAYKLSHLYYNWMGTISVPAPCQYAHKLAFFASTSLHREPKPILSNTLFYL